MNKNKVNENKNAFALRPSACLVNEWKNKLAYQHSTSGCSCESGCKRIHYT